MSRQGKVNKLVKEGREDYEEDSSEG